MISKLAHEYVHLNSIENLEMCKQIIKYTDEKLDKLYDDKKIRGYQLLLLENKLDIEEKLTGRKFAKISKNKYPFVYSLVQPLEKEVVDFDKMMEDLDYIRVDI